MAISKKRIFLGIDPGFGRMGWGVVEAEGMKLAAAEWGCWETPKEECLAKRLCFLAKEMRQTIMKWKPDAVIIEDLFFFKNLKTAIKVAEARGMAILVAAENNAPIIELTPLQVKQAISGYGRADKSQMQTMVKMILKLEKIPKPDDAADALAMAIAGAAYFGKRY